MSSMSHIPFSKLNIKELDNFLKSRPTEGQRLDFKASRKCDLAKAIAAFANTHGGDIIIGVDEDKSTNTPAWPPTTTAHLQDMEPGLLDTVYQAANSIYPPVMSLQTSEVFENPHGAGKAIVVVRVGESGEAPHAIENKSRIYVVVERRGNITDRFQLADIDRVEELSARKGKLASRREETLQKNLARAVDAVNVASPWHWASVSPFYPWRAITPASPLDFLSKKHSNSMLLNGSLGYVGGLENGGSIYKGSTAKPNVTTRISTLTRDGHVFSLLADSIAQVPGNEGEWLDPMDSLRNLAVTMKVALEIYSEKGVETPGLLHLAAGVKGSKGYKASNVHVGDSRVEYPDDDYRHDEIVPFDSLVANPFEVFGRFWDDFSHSFTMNMIPAKDMDFKKLINFLK